MTDLVKVLSIDGGGIRGIIPAMVLSRIEALTNKRTSDMFDLIAGTSTGGIIALGLTTPDINGEARYSAEDLLEMYEEYGSKIFHRSVWKKIGSGWSLLEEKYSTKGLEEVLNEYFEDTRLRDALTNLIIPGYEIEGRFPWFFRSIRAQASEHYDFPMSQVARAASAAPTYFEPEKIVSTDMVDYYALIDGGVFANNPGMCAYVEAKTMFPEVDDVLIVSLGTGELTRRIDYEKAKDWGIAQWAHPILNVVFDGVSDTIDYQLKKLLPHRDFQQRYFRFQCRLDSGDDDLDDASRENIRALKKEADEMIEAMDSDIDALCDIIG